MHRRNARAIMLLVEFSYFKDRVQTSSLGLEACRTHYTSSSPPNLVLLLRAALCRVDAIAFPLSVPLHKRKTLKKDHFPKSSQYNAKVCDFLRTHTAPFRKFPEPFLYWVGIRRYYELDENSYPSFLDDNNEAMDLFSVIDHAGPTKVRVGKIEKASDQVPLLEATRGRVILLVPPILVTAASSEGNMTKSIDMLFDEGNGAEKEHSTGGGEYVVLTKAIIDPVNEDVAEKPRSTGGKSRVVMQDLLDNSKLAAEIEFTDAATMPLITSSVTSTPEHERGDHIDSVFGPNLRTKPATVWFVISSDSSHHSGTHAVDVEVSSLVMSIVSDPLVMTAAVATTAVVETSLVSVPKVTVKPVNPALFGDFMSTSRHGVAGPFSSVHPKLSADSFYAIQDLNPETLHRVYVPKWTVANESILDDPYMCHTLTDQLAPPALFSQLRAMKYDQLYIEFNVGAAHQTCLDAKERDAEITILKSKLSLKETEAGEAIRLCGRVATVEAAKALHAAELNLLKEIKSTLEAKMRSSETKATALEYEKSALLIRCLRWRLLVPNFTTKSLVMRFLKNKSKPYKMSRIARRRWILSLRLKLAVINCLQSPEYLSVLGRAIGRAVDKGIQDDADYVAAVSALRDVDFSLLTLLASQKDASIADIMDSLRLEGPAAKISVPLLSVADHGVVHAGPQDEDPSSGRIVFEKEELETSLEPAVGS
ncbi:hypothetical protein Tco_1153873 [Tanacetum coccineum]